MDKKLYELHKELVDKIITFCKENNYDNVDNVYLNADGLKYSIEQGVWTPVTDSCLELCDEQNNTIIKSI